MVVPYEEKKEIKIYKTPDSKISDIINNNSLNKNDKVNLINKLLIKKQNNGLPMMKFLLILAIEVLMNLLLITLTTILKFLLRPYRY
jgi:F0F1-type ATP synthase delta subunit